MNSKPLRVLYLTSYFDPIPVQKGMNVVRLLQAGGCHVDVATAFSPIGKQAILRRDRLEQTSVYRLPHFRSHDGSAIKRSLTFGTFFLSALIFGLIKGCRYDVVYAYHPPITVGLAAAMFGRVWRLPFVLDVLDLWPDVLAESGAASPSVAWILKKVCDVTYKAATLISVPSRGFSKALIKRGVSKDKIDVIYQFADEGVVATRDDHDLSRYNMFGRFNIVYGGNFGVFQDLRNVIVAARLAHAVDPRVQLVLIGAGSERDMIRRYAEETPEVLQMHPKITMAAIAKVLRFADLALVNLADQPSLRAYIPSKVPFCLALGVPILAGLAGEGAEIIEESGAGFVVPPNNPDAMAAAILDASRLNRDLLAAKGQAGRRFYVERMASSNGVGKLLQLLRRAAQ